MLRFFFALFAAISLSSAVKAGTIFTDDFESGNLLNWTTTGSSPLTIAAGTNVVPVGGTNAALLDNSADRMHRNIIADNGGSEIAGHTVFSYWFYDNAGTATRVFNEIRGYASGTGLPNGGSTAVGTLSQLIAFGKYNSVTLPGDTAWNVNKYQARVAFTTNATIYWFNLDGPNSPNRSVGWHKFTMEREAAGGTIHFYVDGVLARTVTDAVIESLDSLILGFGAGTTVGDGWIDGVELSSGVPTITAHPQAATVVAGGNVSFSVTQVGGTTYQWTHAGTNIPNANASTLNLSGVHDGNVGDYAVIVGNTAGTTTSSIATLSVTHLPDIVFVSDNGPAGFSGPLAGTVDDAFVTFLQNAGYNVIRFNSDNSAAVLLTPEQITALNTNELIILGRSLGSGAFAAGQGSQWNTNITVPIIVQSTFLTRSGQLGWFLGTDAGNRIPMPLTAVSPSDPENAFLFAGVALNGATTANNYDEAGGQGTSHTFDNPVAGANILATGLVTNKVIVEFPAGTAVKGGADILAGYRMYFASGNREPSGGSVPQAGNENLTATGESLFLRAVSLALHGGAAPNLGESPAITSQPSSAAVCIGLPLALSVTATGQDPLSYQWYFSDGATFTNALAEGTGPSLTYPSFDTTNAGFYAVVITNAVGAVTSSVAVVTVAGTGTVASALTSLTNCPGTPAVFTTTATGSGTLTYTWRKDGTIVQGPDAQNSYTIASVVLADAGTYSVEVAGQCNTVTNSATLTVVIAPTITAQPQSQTVPMGNGAVFGVTATGFATQANTYQWRTNGVDVAGATGSSFAISNLTLAASGMQIQVAVSNCVGGLLSSAATLTVTPVSGISFDFNTPGQFTNNPAENVFNDWLFTAQGSFITGFPGNQFVTATYEVPAGGVDGSGALDLAFHANNNVENTITLLPQLFDFSMAGKTLVGSVMFKAKAPTSNNRSTQIGFVTSTNFGIADNTPQGFMSVILQSTAQPALTYQFRLQHRRTDGGITEVTPDAATVNLTAGNWYKVKATFANITDVAANTLAISAQLEDMGPNGTTSAGVVLSYAPTNIVNTSLVQQKYMMLAIRGFENTGVDFRDNIYAHTATGPVVMAAPPESQTVQQGRRATFHAYADGDGPYTYQWNKNGSPIEGARNWKYITPPVTTGDNNAQYTVTVTGPGNSVTSDPATLTVQSETLNVVSVGSVDGCVVGVRFDQAVDPTTAENPANYLINGVAATSAQVYRSSFGVQGRDGIYVTLTPASVLSGAFTVTVQNVQDLSGNAIASPNNTAAGVVEGMTGVDIDPAQARVLGVNYSFAPGQFEIIGGGHDIFGTSDSLRYVYKQKTGDFDIKVRLTDHWTTRAPAKAGLEIRASLAPSSPQVLVYPNPRRPARNTFEATARPTFGAATVGWGPSVSMDAAGYPNAWVRLRRSGNVFLRYSSTDGVNWQFDAQLTQPMPETVFIGLGVCANVGLNNPMFPHAAQFESYGDFTGYAGAAIAITQQPTNVTINAGASATHAVVATLTGGPAQGELTYLWQRSDGLGGWVNLPTAGATNNTASTGPLYTPDNGAQYRVVITAPGAADVTSAVVTVTVNDTAVPTISATAIPAGSAGQFVITFSEPVSAATALNSANYVVTNAAGTVFPISSVSFFGDARTVVITLADVIAAGNYGVRVTGVQDLNGNTLATVVRTFSQTLTPPMSGPVVVELLGAGISGGATANLDAYLAHPRFTGHQPDYVAYSNLFAHNLSFADATYNNYGARVFSLFVAPSNGLYKIWLRSDDAARVFMNTNGADRAGRVLVGENTGANGTYTVKQQGISLTNGQAYFLEAVVREGTGGDGVSVAIRAQADGGTPGATEAVPATQLRFPAAEAFPSTPVIAELYANLGGGNQIADQLAAYDSANFVAGVPTFLFYEPEFGAARDLSNSGLDNYLGRIVSHFVPPSTGLYRFWIRSDDSSQFYMNTNAVNSTDPAGKVLLGQLNNFINVNYQPVAQNVHLIGGQPYFMEGLWKEGGGGDGMTVTFRDQSDGTTPPPTEVIPASMLRFPADQSRFGSISLAGLTPASPVVTAGQTLTLTPRGLKGALPSSITWLRNGEVVALNTTSFTTPRLTLSDNGAIYTVILSNAFSSAQVSVPVTVNPDTTVPTLLGAVASQFGDSVTLTFSEPLEEATATCSVNYLIDGLGVLSAALDTSGTRVILRTSPQLPGTNYTVTVNGVRDASTANTIAPNSLANFGGWGQGGCGVLVEIFTNITGGNEIGRLTGHYKYINNLPDERGYIPGFAFGTSPQAGIPVFNYRVPANLDNYGARLTSYFVAPSNGLYRFYIRGDDATQLFMNPDGTDPGGRMLMARNDGANSTTYDSGTGGSASPVLALEAGQAYYTEALMKEGGGGDYVTVAWRAIDPATLTAIGGIPPNTESIAQPLLLTVGDPAMFLITGTPPPTLTVGENDSVDLRLTGTANPPSIIAAACYQWQRYDAGSMTFTNINGATNGNLTFFAALVDSGEYRLQATLPGLGNLSYVTALTVTNDITAPFIVSANSLDGNTIGVCFNEPVDPNTAGEASNYYLNGDSNFNPATAVIRPEDPRTVLLTMAAPLVGTFTLNATFIGDFASNPNFGDSEVTASVQNLTPLDIGAPLGAGSSWTCLTNEIDVIAGGADIWGASDQGHLTIGQRSGNFDVWVQLASLSRAPLDNDGITKAGLMVRETLDPGARKLQYLAEPPASNGGRDIYEAGQRPTPGAATAAWSGGNGNVGGPAGIPNTWIRIKRVGDLFTAFRSADGATWTQTTTHRMVLSNTVYVGLAATAHTPVAGANPTGTTKAEFRNIHIPNGPTITTQPSPATETVAYGDPMSYTVTVSNPNDGGTLTYQWKRNGVDIPGANSATLNIPSAGFTDGGVYTVLVSNDGGQVTSDGATLIVAPPELTPDVASTTDPNAPFNIVAADLLTNDTGGAGFTVTAVSGIAPVTYSADFNTGTPAGAIFGNATAEVAGGVANSGYIRLTPGIASQNGSLIFDELTPTRRVSAFRADFKLRIAEGSGEPADGFSFNFAPDLPIGVAAGRAAEDGQGNGFSFCVDNYRFLPFVGVGSPAGSGPSTTANTSGMKINYRGLVIAGVQMPAAWNSDRWVPVSIIVNGSGDLTVLVDGTNVFGNVVLPWTPSAGRFGLYARTGGQFASHGVDDFSATVFTSETGRPSTLGADLFGSAYLEGGVMHITDAVNGQVGSYILHELTPGAAVTSFTASFKLQIGSGSADGADGFSFNFANDLPLAASGAGAAEEGFGTGLSLTVDNYPGTGAADSPSLKLKYGGTLLGLVLIPKWNSPNFIPVSVNLDADGTIDVTVDGTNVVANFATPYVPTMGRFGFYARTGGLNQRHWVDDVVINVTTAGSPGSYSADFNLPAYASVALNNGTITYTPQADGCGADTFYYIVSDPLFSGFSAGEVAVNVICGPGGPITIINPIKTLTTFTASFNTEAGVNYQVRYKDTIDALTWTTLTVISGDGTVKSFTDNGPLPPTRFYQIFVP